jgi:DNA repair protein RadD
MVPVSYSNCPACGYAFPPPDPKPRHEPKASEDAVLSGEVTDRVLGVTDVVYSVHEKKGAEPGDPRTLRVDYFDGPMKVGSEWVCFEHTGFAWQKAFNWWCVRCAARIPKWIEEAVTIGSLDLIRKPRSITVREISGQRFPSIVGHDFTDIPIEEVDQEWLDDWLRKAKENAEDFEDDEVPF